MLENCYLEASHFSPRPTADFTAVRGPMFFGPVLEFDEILTAVRGFEQRFNRLVLPL